MSVLEWRLLGDKTLSGVARELQRLFTAEGLEGKVVDAGFDAWLRESLDPTSATRKAESAVWIYWPSPRLIENDDCEAELECVLSAIQTAKPTPTILFGNFFADPIVARPLTNTLALQARAARLNDRLQSFAKTQAGFYLIDQASLALREGLRVLTDPRFEAIGQLYYSPAGALASAKLIFRAARALVRPSAKVLVLDLDNTLWGGILGEDGAANLFMGPTDRGFSYRRFQEALLELKREGVMLALCSKNDEAPALEVLRTHPDCLLRPQDFVAHAINWQSKSENLRAMASKLRLGLDAFVFVDDSAFEREEMRRLIPELRVLEFPADPSGLVAMLSDTPVFDTLGLTDEDRRRASLYEVENRRSDLLATATSMEDFYRSLDSTLEIFRGDAASAERLHQLVLKTNQFNLTTERLAGDEFRSLLVDPQVSVWGLRVGDRLGDSGVTGLAVVHRGPSEWVVTSFLLSCRVIGRTVEFAFMRWLADRARVIGVQRLVLNFVPSAKNGVAAEFLGKSGFRPENGDVLKAGRWVLELDAASVATLAPHYVRIDDGKA